MKPEDAPSKATIVDTSEKEVEEHLRREQLRVLVGQTPVSLAAQLVIFVLFVVALEKRGGVAQLGWCVALWVTGASLRLIALRIFRVSAGNQVSLGRTLRLLRLYSLGASCSGGTWGLIAWNHLDPAQPLVFSLVVFAVGGMTAGATGSLNAHLPAISSFVLSALGPPAWRLLLGADGLEVAGGACLLFAAASVLFARKAHAALNEAISLRVKNEGLVRSLGDEKDEALRARAEAERVTQAKSHFLAAVSHDLRQPLHAQSLFLAALRKRCQDESLTALLNRVTEAGEALRDILETFLEFSRIDAGAIKPELSDVDVQQTFERLSKDFESLAEEAKCELVIRSSRFWVKTDQVLLETMLRNLISNALRYAPGKSVELSCEPGESGTLRLRVSDQGPGIAEELREEIFDEFVQLGNQERSRAKGMGLGLAIVQRLAQLLGLELGVDSREGGGASFWIDVPRGELTQALPLVREESAGVALNGAKILVLDDQQEVRDGLTALLEALGVASEAFSDGEHLLERLRQNSDYGAIVCDLRLPGEDGVQIMRQAEQLLGAQPRALLVTGDTSPNSLRRAHNAGMLLLHKPVPPDQLASQLAKLLESK